MPYWQVTCALLGQEMGGRRKHGHSGVWEDTMGHDQLFKLLLQAFFADFITLFAPRWRRRWTGAP